MPNTQLIQAAGDAVLPPAGSLLAQFLGFFTIRGKTQHLTYPEAVSQANIFNHAIQALWKANLEMPDYNIVSQKYLPRLLEMITNGKYGCNNTWGINPVTIAASVQNADAQLNGDIDGRVFVGLFFHFVYILMNEDVSRVEETAFRIWACQVNAIFSDTPSLTQISTQGEGAQTSGTPPALAGAQGMVLAGLAGLAAFFLLTPKR